MGGGNARRWGYHICISRGAGYAECDEKPEGRVGRVRPAAAVQGRGRQEADLQGKNANMDVCVFFYFSTPGYGRGLPLPL
jgi:hypothetical protein